MLGNKTNRIVILVDSGLLTQVDNHRFRSRCVSRSDAIRGLLISALSDQNQIGEAEAATSPRLDHSVVNATANLAVASRPMGALVEVAPKDLGGLEGGDHV